jgi:hypothetical protein
MRITFLRNALILALLTAPLQAADWVYSVVDGDNLWDFSKKYLDSVMRFEQLRKLNNIKNPKRLQPGSWLRVPMKWIRSSAVPVRVDRAVGRVKITRTNGAVDIAIKPGALIHLGDTLKTGPESSVAVVFADGSALTLYSDAEMRFDHLNAYGKTGMVDSRLHLGRGRLQTRIKPSTGPGSRFEIHTPSAITAVRGTAYRAAISPEGDASRFEVLEGDVVVTGADEQALVSAGFGTRVSLGEAPVKPRKLLPPPQLSPVPEPIRALDWQLGWQAIEGADRYRVEISENRQLDVLLWEKLISESHVKLPDLIDGDYWVRVRGVDSDRLEGRSVVQKLILDRHPQPPQSSSPADGAMLRHDEIVLKWEASIDAHGYLLEVANDQAFQDSVIKRQVGDLVQFTLTEISEPGRYYWRVSAISKSGELGVAGDIRSWQLRPELVPPNVTISEAEEHVSARWELLKPDQRYHVQLAHDPEFSELEIDRIVSKNEISFNLIYSQLRYLRVSTVDADNYHGPWSDVHKIDPLLGIGIWVAPVSFIIGLLLL